MTHTTHHKDSAHHRDHSSSSSPQKTVSVLTDRQPVNHREEQCAQNIISVSEEQCAQNIISVSEEQCAQNIISATEEQRAQNINSVSEEQCEQTHISLPNTTEVEVDIHAEEIGAQHLVHFIEVQDQSDSGSLTTQAPHSSSIRATINALSTWISAVQPRESWYLAGWIKDSPIDFLVDPGAVVSAISLQCYERLVDAGAIHTPLKLMQMELEAANKSDDWKVPILLYNSDPCTKRSKRL